MAADISNVMKVYSGKSGHCCCGCAGKYSYNSQYRELGGKDRGYPLNDSDINDRSVKIIAGKVLGNPEAVYEHDFAYVDTGSRLLMVVFADKSAS